jgi:hypothetical protein
MELGKVPVSPAWSTAPAVPETTLMCPYFKYLQMNQFTVERR